ncbi:MAG: hypothetical protein KIT31_18665 [Deltaproteobacteria bacterium]|nr:hypothetical protein [Deltaproteobacteria bacterium]
MSGPKKNEHAPQPAGSPPVADADPATVLHIRPRGDLPAIREILLRDERRADYKLLPELAAVLTAADKQTFLAEDMHRLTRVPGDIALDVAKELRADLSTTVAAALAGSPKVAATHLARYLASKRLRELATLDGAVVDGVKGTLKQPLMLAIPDVARNLDALAMHQGFLTWLVESAPPGVVAQLMSKFGSAQMAATLDAGKLWSWVGHVTLVNANVAELARATTDPDAQKHLRPLTGPRLDTRWEPQLDEMTKPGLEEELAAPTSVRGILAAAGRDGASTDEVGGRAIQELQRLRATADEVLAATADLAFNRKLGLRVLLSAGGVTAQHITTYLAQSAAGPLELLADDALRAGVRRHKIGLLNLLAPDTKVASNVELILANDAVARWFVDEAGPEDLLELIGGDPARAPKAARFVAAKYPDWSWVWQLTSPASGADKTMRVLALNCPHAKAASYLRDVLLGDPSPDAYKGTPIDNDAHPTDQRVFGGEKQRLDEALKGSGDDVMARLADLNDLDRASLGKSRDTAGAIGAKVGVEHYARAAYLLGLPFGHAIHGSPAPSTLLLSYLATRPRTEELAAAMEWELVDRASRQVNPDVLRVFPSLQQPAVLAKALGHNPNLLRTLLEGSDPSRVVELLGHDDVRPHVEPVLRFHTDWLGNVPHYQHLSKRGRDGLDRLARDAKDGDVRDSLDEVKSSPEESGPRPGEALHGAREQRTLDAAIGALVDAGAGPTSMLALLEERKLEVPKLLAAPGAWRTVQSLLQVVDVPPDVALPWISRHALLDAPNALRWWLSWRDGSALLHAVAGADRGRQAVATELDRGSPGARDWLQRLPVGPALSDVEEATLLRLRPLISSVAVLRELFRVLYGVPLPSAWDEQHVRATFDVVSRLPSAHLQQQRVREITLRPMTDGVSGLWSPHRRTIELDPGLGPGSGEDTFHPGHQPGWFTPQEMQTIYGLDERALADKVAGGEVRQLSLAVPLYRPAEQRHNLFSATLLHEFGHSVDDILGGHTPPVYEYAGWQEHSDFDAWAAAMGGWERVAPADRAKIRTVILDAHKANVPALEIAPPDHAIRAPQYRDVAVVKTALSGATFEHTSRVEHHGRVFSLKAENQLFSLDAKAAIAAPSNYSLKAPAEYFAESYVAYYIEPAKKGGMLPAQVKDWFARNVDVVRFDPARMKDGKRVE